MSSFLEHMSNEESQLSSADISANVLSQKITGKLFIEFSFPLKADFTRICFLFIFMSGTETPICNLQHKPMSKTTRAVTISGLCQQPKPYFPPAAEACPILEVSQSLTVTSRSQESLKTSTHTEPEAEGKDTMVYSCLISSFLCVPHHLHHLLSMWDLCAAILLACLFCHPLDCLLATVRGCNSCIWALCSSFCGCEPTTLQPLLDIIHHCDLCGIPCFLCDCPVCDICLQATECLDLAMEISQMLYHWCLKRKTSRHKSTRIIYLWKSFEIQLVGTGHVCLCSQW